MTEWKKLNGRDEQIAEMESSPNGWICRFGLIESDIHRGNPHICVNVRAITHYFIIPDDPLRYMKVRQSLTGQPVWYKHKIIKASGQCNSFHMPFIQPETYEYSFTPFEGEV